MTQSEYWVCSNPNCQQANPQHISEFLFRPLKGTRYKECSTCRKAKLRDYQRRRKEEHIAYHKARLLKLKDEVTILFPEVTMTHQPNGPARPIRPLPQDDEPPEEWDEEVAEDLPEEDQGEPVPPS